MLKYNTDYRKEQNPVYSKLTSTYRKAIIVEDKEHCAENKEYKNELPHYIHSFIASSVLSW